MIISHKYRYIFIELPHTASTAISSELCEFYDGQEILHKHAHYHEFLESSLKQEQDYFIFAGIRNPLDVITTLYFKRKTNHQNFYTTPEHWRRNGGHVSNQALKEFRFISENDASFSDYLTNFYRIPYDSWGSPRPENFDFVIRFENLQSDFSMLLDLLSIEQLRPLPTRNKTSQKTKNFMDYYSPDTYDHVCSIFGPYMKIWEYKIPANWGDCQPNFVNNFYFNLLTSVRQQLVWGSSPFAKLFQNFRAKSLLATQ